MDTGKIGRFIQINRKKQNLTQRQLGEKLGVTGKTVSRWENGNYMPDLSLLQPLAQELGITLNELLQGEYINAENIYPEAEQALKMTVDYSAEKIKKEKSTFHKVCAAVAVLLFLLFVGEYIYTDMYLTFRTAEECRNFVYADINNYREGEAEIHYADRKYNGDSYQICFFVSEEQVTMFVTEQYKGRYRVAGSGICNVHLSDIKENTAPCYLYTLYDEQDSYENDLHIMWNVTYENIREVKVKNKSFRPLTDKSGLKMWFTSTNTYWDMNNIEYIHE